MVLFPDIPKLPSTALDLLSEQSRHCILRLAAHNSNHTIDLASQPTRKLAAVLILLYERAGKLRVLLTTRSKHLRSHPGQTALPGGKVDETDEHIAYTAYREANEEVNLPFTSPHIHTITTLRPFISLHHLLVTPVVSLCTDPSILESLKPCQDEVDAIFDHPIEAFLDPSIALDEPLVPKGSENWPYDSQLHHSTDVLVGSSKFYRVHRFRGTASPIKGLTADIMIHVSQIAYGMQATFEVAAPNQQSGIDAIIDHLESERKQQVNGFNHREQE